MNRKMQVVYKTINRIQTQLFTWGDLFDNDGGSDVVVCVTGNPGVPDFYIEFASELHENTALPVCIIGHAGHVEVPHKESNVLDNNQHLFNLEGQREHKLDFINNHIDKKRKLHLIGHSIGAWLLIELLHADDSLLERVLSINFLFPTIQRMAETRNGKFLNGILRRVHLLVVLFFTLVNLLPETVQSLLIGLYLKYYSLPAHYNERILKYLNPKVGEKVLFMAYDEMDKVTTLNVKAIDRIKHVTNVIYSNRDGWAPTSYMDDLKPFQPRLQMREVSINHAFVLKSSEKVAEMVAEFINLKKSISQNKVE